jgi:hypothetical protein
MKSKVLSFEEITAGIDKVISNTEVLVESRLGCTSHVWELLFSV